MAVDTPAHIAIFGGGPIGIETGLYARYLGYDVQIFECEEIASPVLMSAQERLPFRVLRSTLGLAALAAQDPDFNFPADEAELTAREWVDRYLAPLSRTDFAGGSHSDGDPSGGRRAEERIGPLGQQ